MIIRNITVQSGALRALLLISLFLFLGGCASNKPINKFSPEEIASLEVTLEGTGTIMKGRFTSAISDWIWTCKGSPPMTVNVVTANGKASVKLKAYGRIFRSDDVINSNGEIDSSFNLGPTGEFDTHAFIHTTVQMNKQRAKILFNYGRGENTGCSSKWFDLVEL